MNMPIDPEVLQQLRSNDKKLTSLDLCNDPLTFEDILLLTQALEHNDNLTDLDLTSTGIDDACVRLLAKIDNSALRILHLGDNKIGSEGAKAFEHNRTYTCILFAKNPIGPEGAIALARNITLRNLDLGWCDIGDLGCQALLANPRFEDLWLPANKITHEGFKNVSGPHPSLRELHLIFNPIGDEGAIKIAQTLAKGPRLHELDLHQTSLTDKGALAFKGNTTIQELDLTRNNIREETIKLLREDFAHTVLHQTFEKSLSISTKRPSSPSGQESSDISPRPERRIKYR
jgi:hypothetical protein